MEISEAHLSAVRENGAVTSRARRARSNCIWSCADQSSYLATLWKSKADYISAHGSETP